MAFRSNLPGETPLDDYSGLRLKWVRNQRQLNQAEFENSLLAIEKYLARKPTIRMAPFSREWMLGVHREMFGRVWAWAGRIRDSQTNIGVPVHQIMQDMENLALDVEIWRACLDDLAEQGAMLHYRLVYIHPFPNGNGRWARLLANIWITQNGGRIVLWPEKDIRQEKSLSRGPYLEALKLADKGDFRPLILLHEKHSRL